MEVDDAQRDVQRDVDVERDVDAQRDVSTKII